MGEQTVGGFIAVWANAAGALVLLMIPLPDGRAEFYSNSVTIMFITTLLRY